ncbi:(2Fe-2S) ferredoxin domain-containing protein [Cohnella thailandensis]|uniref:(2Fe-2S) ferredoxin domain-containing protein n=1 Tax=Cohnella thailandensis TaxID=557557 RepID=A0A841SR84_9BACL|nr:(2Fe-2S) ferredoxin domain-containing protein [Cohnella thailandensis]MBB6633116.1 (2Fe-2S) ferredoxin domain-containing protein [Cohnella thailandensis]MBP1975189.1 (2Fe-2S) ferredoxin [Cohnella thailandensis]
MNTKIMVCSGKMCVKKNGEEAIEAVAASILKEVELLSMRREVEVGLGKCMRSCSKGCVVTTHPDGNKYFKVTPESGREIVSAISESQACVTA